MKSEIPKFQIWKFQIGLAVLLKGCGSAPVPVDVEREKIAAWVDAYGAAAVRAERTRLQATAEYPTAVAEMHARRADLERVWSHPDGRRYVDEDLARMGTEQAGRIAALLKRELDLASRGGELGDDERAELGRVAEERYDLEIRASRLAHLLSVLPR